MLIFVWSEITLFWGAVAGFLAGARLGERGCAVTGVVGEVRFRKLSRAMAIEVSMFFICRSSCRVAGVEGLDVVSFF
jgi:hypothetical protein